MIDTIGNGAYVAVGPDHSVYYFWLGGPGNTLRVRRSTDLGVTFAAPNVIRTLTTAFPNGGLSAPAGYRTNAFPSAAVNPVNGSVYVVHNDINGVDRGDIYFQQSTDGGVTFSARIKVNTDATTKMQAFPAIAVTPDGTKLGITWYDNRNSPGTTNNIFERWGRVAAISGGVVTFASDFLIAETPSTPTFGSDPAVSSLYMGDYDSMEADNSFFYTTFLDTRLGASAGQDVRMAKFPATGPAPDFILEATPVSQEICVGSPAIYNVTLGSISGFANPVTLSTSEAPGTSVFVPPAPTPPGSSALTVTGAPAGTHNFNIVGAAAGSPGHSFPVSLLVRASTTGSPELIAPANGTTAISLNPTFTWSAVTGATTYTIEVATDAGFTNIVASASGLTTTSWLSTTLSTSTTYFWRVRGVNACGQGANSPVFSFTTGCIATTTVSYTGPPVPIPDISPAGVNINLPVSGVGAVADVNFRFDVGGACDGTFGNTNAAMDHTFIGDLIFRLTSPGGTTATFQARRGGERDNICLTTLDDDGGFPNISTLMPVDGQPEMGNFAPETTGRFSMFDGQNANGTWELNVSDDAFLDSGSMRRFSLVITGVGICPTPTATPTATPTPACTPGTAWTAAATYPAIIQSPAVGSDGTYVYSAGGLSGGLTTNAAFRYDPVGNYWSPLPALPMAVFAGRGVFVPNTNSFYVFGGFNGAVAISNVQRYDVATTLWSVVATMPAPRYFSNVAFNPATGKIIVQGGFDTSFNESGQTWEFDPMTNSWNTSRADSPLPLAGSATGIIGQFMYVAGTWNSGFPSNVHYRYDLIGNLWTPMTPVPAAMYVPAVGVFNNKMYVVGGGDPFRPGESSDTEHSLRALGSEPDTSYATTRIFDPASNTWSSGPNTIVSHARTAGAVVGNNMFVIGGYNGSVDTNFVEKLFLGCTAINGLVTYENAAVPVVPVAGTILNGSGVPNVFAATDLSGNYSLTGFGPGAYTVAPSRPNILSTAPNGIFSNDAVMIARHVVGLITLNPVQQRAAQVSGGGTITAADAGFIARWIVGFNDVINQTGRWKFTPPSRMYASAINTENNQDYLALLMGDVNGDWAPGLPRDAEPSLLFTTVATVSAPHVAVPQGSELKVPIRIDGLAATAVSSYQLDLEYDPMVITPDVVAADLSGTLSDGLIVASNVFKPGLLKVVVYGVLPVYGDGVYVTLRFTATGRGWSSTPLVISGFRFNDGRDKVTSVAGQVAIEAPPSMVHGSG